MTEHEKLEYICDKIWHKVVILKDHECYNCDRDLTLVKEIIFTPEFVTKYIYHVNTMDKFADDTNLVLKQEISFELMFTHLNNPVDFLYNLIKN